MRKESLFSDPLYRKAYYTYRNQRSRCNNANDKCFSHYGEKGIVVEYSKSEFIDWFIKNYPYEDAGNNDYVVGRIDHDKSYSFDNIRFETMEESSKEVMDRYKKRRPVVLYSWQTGEDLIIFPGIRSAADHLGLHHSSVKSQCNNYELGKNRNGRPRSGFAFKYYTEEIQNGF